MPAGTANVKKAARVAKPAPAKKGAPAPAKNASKKASLARKASAVKGPVPVTILSGFLGAGKTTLLEHILKNKEGLRCAVVVNDMAEINIDASLVKGAQLVQTKEEMVELHNGCICCTLRQDLLIALRDLARDDKFDVIVIESTGVSEPMQVAETFFIDQDDGHGILNSVARLDSCVTVIDASTFYVNLKSLDNVTEKYGKDTQVAPSDKPVPEGGNAEDEAPACDADDDRNIAHLLIDQVEFANVILLNKMDLVSKERVNETLALVRTLNPTARIICTTNSNVDLCNVVSTGLFSEEFAMQASGWMSEVEANVQHTPETLEYGIGSFVYRSDRAFHPGRLHSFFHKYFMVQEETSGEAEPEDESVDPESFQPMTFADPLTGAAEGVVEPSEKQDKTKDELRLMATDLATVRRNELGNLFRSKGYLWIGAPARVGAFGVWNHAGNILRFRCGGGWDMFPDVPGAAGETMATKSPGQEIVMIGQDLKRDVIAARLDECLLTDDEWRTLTHVMNTTPTAALGAVDLFEDPFEDWDDVDE